MKTCDRVEIKTGHIYYLVDTISHEILRGKTTQHKPYWYHRLVMPNGQGIYISSSVRTQVFRDKTRAIKYLERLLKKQRRWYNKQVRAINTKLEGLKT